MIRAVVWNEFVHERENAAVRAIYPEGIHATIAAALAADEGIERLDRHPRPARARPARRPPEGHRRPALVGPQGPQGRSTTRVVDRVVQRVHEGMGLIVLHSGHFSKPFIRLMGTPCSLRWREAGERERLWVVNRSHPITQRIGDRLELPSEEMYGEPFLVPEPLETVLISWFEGGEVFRSGLTYQRGAGRIFYFRPGHETYPTYHDATVQQILRNAVRWAYNPAAAWHDVAEAPNVPVDRAPEKITAERRRRCTSPARRATGERRHPAAADPRHRRHRPSPRRAFRAPPRLRGRRRRRRQRRARPRLRRQPRDPARLRQPRRRHRLGRVRRRRQLHPRRRPQADDDAADRRRASRSSARSPSPSPTPTPWR